MDNKPLPSQIKHKSHIQEVTITLTPPHWSCPYCRWNPQKASSGLRSPVGYGKHQHWAASSHSQIPQSYLCHLHCSQLGRMVGHLKHIFFFLVFCSFHEIYLTSHYYHHWLSISFATFPLLGWNMHVWLRFFKYFKLWSLHLCSTEHTREKKREI